MMPLRLAALLSGLGRRPRWRRALAALIVGIGVVGIAVGGIGTLGLVRAGHAQAPPDGGPLAYPVFEGWTLVVNTGGQAGPTALFTAQLPDLAAAFTYDAATATFRAFRPGGALPSTLSAVPAGAAVWLFVPAGRLDGDVAFWTREATVGPRTVTLGPGFNLVGWTGSRLRVSVALAGLPVSRAWAWDAAGQRFRTWNPALPAAVNDDFPLQYGDGLWVQLDGDSSLPWVQG